MATKCNLPAFLWMEVVNTTNYLTNKGAQEPTMEKLRNNCIRRNFLM